jgi:glutamate racemase
MLRAPRPDDPIGLFDSGLGGLTVARELFRALPGEHLLYVGDTARRPFELRPEDEVRAIALELVGFLAARGAKLVVFGCNTATAAGLDAAHRAFPDLPLVGMIAPAARAAVRERISAEHLYGVVASTVTLGSGAYDRALRACDRRALVVGSAPQALFRRCEAGELDDLAAVRRLVEFACVGPLEDGCGALVLACSDLPWIRDVFVEVAAGRCPVIDPAEEAAREAAQELDARGLRRTDGGAPRHAFLVTGGDADHFRTHAGRWLGIAPEEVSDLAPAALRLESRRSIGPAFDDGRNG